MEEVVSWLIRQGQWAELYVDTFRLHRVDGNVLLMLTDADLQELGLTGTPCRRLAPPSPGETSHTKCLFPCSATPADLAQENRQHQARHYTGPNRLLGTSCCASPACRPNVDWHTGTDRSGIHHIVLALVSSRAATRNIEILTMIVSCSSSTTTSFAHGL